MDLLLKFINGMNRNVDLVQMLKNLEKPRGVCALKGKLRLRILGKYI
jgi:hypothetical protein